MFKKLNLLFCLFFTLFSFSGKADAFAEKSSNIYQLQIFQLSTKAQETRLDAYLKNAYMPALHRFGIKSVGVFKTIEKDSSANLVYVFVPFKSLNDLDKLSKHLKTDADYLNNGKEFIDVPYNNVPYVRMQSIILEAFSGMPNFAAPNLTSPKSERIYELRDYESATEKIGLNKIEMFNKYEIDIFSKLDFNAIFYGQVLSGPKIPDLIYLTTYNNMADHETKWKAFGAAYDKVNKLPQYQNNVSHITSTFLRPTEYSDL
ncbi:hypothetical protein ACVWYG_001008 [Pedobacter sp. UYEF25]